MKDAWADSAPHWHLLMAEALAKLFRMQAALNHIDSSEILLRGTTAHALRAEGKYVRGQILTWAGDFDAASTAFEGALSHFESARMTDRATDCIRELGWVLYRQQQYDLAMEKYRAARSHYAIAGNAAGLAKVYNHMGLVAADSYGDKTNKVAFAYFDSALARARPARNHSGLTAIHSNLGSVLMFMGETSKAKPHLDSALWHAERTGDLRLRSSVALTLGEFHLYSDAPFRALVECKRALKEAERNGALTLERDAMLCVHNAYKLIGNADKASESLWRYIELRDSVVSEVGRENVLKRSLIETAKRQRLQDSVVYVVELARSEGERLRAEVQSQRRYVQVLLLGLGLPLIVVGSTALFAIDRRRRSARYQRDRSMLEMKMLRSQMNPHFIFNALNSINNYVHENERDLASGFLTKFARLMRLVLENSRHDEVPLAQDLEALRLYMDLEQARMNNRFRYEVEVDPAIDQEETMVPPLVLQPFVENAIWHGLSRKEGSGLLRLSVKQGEGALVMTVEDDGVGRNATEGPNDPMAPPKTSMGTGITQERLAMLGKQRGGEAGFRYVDVPQGTHVELVLPLAQGSVV